MLRYIVVSGIISKIKPFYLNPGIMKTVSYPSTKFVADQVLDTPKIILRVGELFVGAGGFGLGFVLANHSHVSYRPLFAIDLDIVALNSYKRNIKWLSEHTDDVLHNEPHIKHADITTIDMSSIMDEAGLQPGDLDILIGGPPCQGFSSSNKTRNVQDKHNKNKLVSIFLDRVNELRPRMFLIENVQGVRWTEHTSETYSSDNSNISSSNSKTTGTTVQEFLIQKARHIGYKVWSSFQDAADFGVPQHRLRFFLFGIRYDLTNDKNVSLEQYLNKYKTDKVSVKSAISDLPSLQNGEVWNGTDYEPDTGNKYIRSLRNYMTNGDLYDHFATKHKGEIIKRFSCIPEGQNWEAVRDMMTTYTNIDNTHGNIYRRLQSDQPAYTISHYRKSMVIHPSQDRGLSFREACRLQSCPDWFRFEGTRGQQQQQLANLVPPLMASKIALAIADYCIAELDNKIFQNKDI